LHSAKLEITNWEHAIPKLFDRIFCEFPTSRAYRERAEMIAGILSSSLSDGPNQVTLINDITGTIFASLYPLVAVTSGKISLISDHIDTFSYTEFSLRIRSSRVKYDFQFVDRLDIFSGGAEDLSYGEQNTIVLQAILDYLPDALAFRLMQKCHKALVDEGKLIVTALQQSADESLFCDFFGWATIRRSEAELLGLLQAAGFGVEKVLHSDSGSPAILLLASKEK
jgi:hypothetical protein